MKRWAKCVICGMMFVVTVEPTGLLFASQHPQEKHSIETPIAFWTKPIDSPFLPEYEREEHTHQEDKSPQQYRATYDYSIGTSGVSIQKVMSYELKKT